VTGPSARGPLAGVGVIVTRPARQAGPFAQKLGVMGARPIVFSTIAILPPHDAAALAAVHASLSHYDAAIFVSANAAEYGVPQAPWPSAVAAYATGPGSAAALVDLGVPGVQFPAQRHDSEGLLALASLADVAGKRFVVFRGDGGRDLLGETLRLRGAHVDFVTAYRRQRPTAGAEGLQAVLARGDADALTLTSSEGTTNLVDVLDREGRARIASLPAFASHPRIAARARELGLHAIETASGDAGLIAGLLQWFGRHPAGIDRHPPP